MILAIMETGVIMTNKFSGRMPKNIAKCVAFPLASVLALLFGLLAPWATPAHADRWITQCVDCPRQFMNMTDRSLRLDAQGYPHIAYGMDHLYYAKYDGVQWHSETADSSPRVGEHASLVLDGSNNPHISYYDLQNEDLKFAYKDQFGWHTETVDSEGNVGRFTSLALDENGYPHIGYHIDYYLKYAFQDSEGWHIETVDLTSRGRAHTSLVLDEDGYPNISFQGNQGLAFAYKDHSGWHTETVDSGSDGAYTSLALDTNGYPHISYLARESGHVKYAFQDAVGWHIEIIEHVGEYDGYTSLALDRYSRPHTSYHDSENYSLKYAHKGWYGWEIEVLDDGGLDTIGANLRRAEPEPVAPASDRARPLQQQSDSVGCALSLCTDNE